MHTCIYVYIHTHTNIILTSLSSSCIIRQVRQLSPFLAMLTSEKMWSPT